MPNIRSQKIDATGIEIIASDGRVFSRTYEEIRTFFQGLSGRPADKANATVQWIRDGITATLGEEQIPTLLLDLTFDQSTWRATLVSIRG